MAADLSITVCRPVRVIEQVTGTADETIAVGKAVRFDTTTGGITKANATSAAEARCIGLAIKAANFVNEAITVVRKGILDVGNALGELTYDDDVYLSNTDGTLSDTAGSNSLRVGTVVPGLGSTTPDKLLRVDL